MLQCRVSAVWDWGFRGLSLGFRVSGSGLGRSRAVGVQCPRILGFRVLKSGFRAKIVALCS